MKGSALPFWGDFLVCLNGTRNNLAYDVAGGAITKIIVDTFDQADSTRLKDQL
jgi:hypothetical protein